VWRPRDIRKTLLWIFGFSKKKGGSGNLLDPGAGVLRWAQKAVFASHFAKRLDQGEDPVTARGNASTDAFEEVVDDRTLQRYLREVFRLKNLPLTIEEWKPVTDWFRVTLKTAIRQTSDNH
jgi:hypothetical protein